jgi:hypothetical protein
MVDIVPIRNIYHCARKPDQNAPPLFHTKRLGVNSILVITNNVHLRVASWSCNGNDFEQSSESRCEY